MGRTERT